MFKSSIAICGLALLALVMSVSAGADGEYDREAHRHDLRRRLGHFKEQPYIDLYKHYAAAFIFPKYKDRDTDDYRNYMPAADQCVVFLKAYRAQGLKLLDLDELVVLDACLGYLYDEGAQEFDEEIKELKQFAEFPELKKLYTGAHVNELSEDGKSCVADLLMNIIAAKFQFRDVECNNHFLQVYLQFAECQKAAIPVENRSSDTYLEVLYRLVRERVNSCVDIEAGHIENAVRRTYESRKVARLANTIKSRFSTISAEERQRMWPKEVTRLLAAVQDTTHQVNTREVHQLLRGVMVNDPKLKSDLLKNLAKYADKTIHPKRGKKHAQSLMGDDPRGLARYTDLIDSMCNYFRASDSESQYDFATPIIRLTQLLNYRDLFDISPEQFVRRFLTHAIETKPIYLSVQACNILTYTEGVIANTAGNSEQHYQVMFKTDTKGMVLWPVADHY